MLFILTLPYLANRKKNLNSRNDRLLESRENFRECTRKPLCAIDKGCKALIHTAVLWDRCHWNTGSCSLTSDLNYFKVFPDVCLFSANQISLSAIRFPKTLFII